MPNPSGKGPLRIAIEDFLTTFGIGEFIRLWLDKIVTAIVTPVQNALTEMKNEQSTHKYAPQGFLEKHLGAGPTDRVIKFFLGIFGLAGVFLDFLRIAGHPNNMLLTREMERLWEGERPDLTKLLEIKRRVPGMAGTIDVWIAELGYGPAVRTALDITDHPLIAVRDYFEAWARGLLTQSELNAKLSEGGLADREISILTDTFANLPSVNQALELAQRQALDNSVAGRFGLDDGISSEFMALMKKLHYDEPVARQLWRLTRQLPNLNQAFEMEHRLRPGRSAVEFTGADLDYILKSNGVPSYFAERLKGISNTPYPRLIIQGMYRAGTIDASEVLEAVKDLGYVGEQAQKVTDYLTREVKSVHQGLTRDAIINAYKDGLYSHDQARAGILAIGLTAEDTDFYLSLADYELSDAITKVKLSVIQARYVGGSIDDVGLAGELGRLNLASERVNVLQELWTAQRNNKSLQLSSADLSDMLINGVITHDDYVKRLDMLGYDAQTIQWLVFRADQIIAVVATGGVSGAQTEQQRLATATRASQYQKDKANNDVLIAEYRAAISALNLSDHNITDPAQLATDKLTIAQYRDIIVQLQAANAQLKVIAVTKTTP